MVQPRLRQSAELGLQHTAAIDGDIDKLRDLISCFRRRVSLTNSWFFSGSLGK